MVKKKNPRPFATWTQEFLFRKVTCKDVMRNGVNPKPTLHILRKPINQDFLFWNW
jgi:hypothetical protein